jgi:hypothetical protein
MIRLKKAILILALMGFSPGSSGPEGPPCLSAVVPGLWDEGGKVAAKSRDRDRGRVGRSRRPVHAGRNIYLCRHFQGGSFGGRATQG